MPGCIGPDGRAVLSDRALKDAHLQVPGGLLHFCISQSGRVFGMDSAAVFQVAGGAATIIIGRIECTNFTPCPVATNMFPYVVQFCQGGCLLQACCSSVWALCFGTQFTSGRGAAFGQDMT